MRERFGRRNGSHPTPPDLVSVWSSVCRPACIADCLPVRPSVRSSVRLSLCLSIDLSVRRSVIHLPSCLCASVPRAVLECDVDAAAMGRLCRLTADTLVAEGRGPPRTPSLLSPGSTPTHCRSSKFSYVTALCAIPAFFCGIRLQYRPTFVYSVVRKMHVEQNACFRAKEEVAVFSTHSWQARSVSAVERCGSGNPLDHSDRHRARFGPLEPRTARPAPEVLRVSCRIVVGVGYWRRVLRSLPPNGG